MSKIIAVYGSPGSGKSTFSLSLATQLALRKQNVVLLSTDRVVPMLKVFVPSVPVDRSLSVGGLFLGTGITQEDVCSRILFHPKCNCLGFMGLATGDTPNTYSGIYTADKMQSLYSILLGLTDTLIVDCMANPSPAYDPLGSVAIANAALLVKTLTPDIQGLEYNKAILPLVSDSISGIRQFTLLGKNSPTRPEKEFAAAAGETIEYTLSESAEIADFFVSGHLMVGAKTKEGKAYLDTVKSIALEAIKE
ncbi:hypothetical protein U6B65_14720 (plasmid) [Oscillospiraceae bacterium MB08-C2-2]|nr:hypothetical protein U6B65_14720 [Oscillospiraceae bacterium MB08-C2-2]